MHYKISKCYKGEEKELLDISICQSDVMIFGQCMYYSFTVFQLFSMNTFLHCIIIVNVLCQIFHSYIYILITYYAEKIKEKFHEKFMVNDL